MTIQVPSDKITFTPDFDDNMQLEEDQRMKIVLSKPADLIVQRKAVSLNDDGKAMIDTVKIALLHIVKIINPPTLAFDTGRHRDMTIEDIGTLQVLRPLYDQIMEQIGEHFRNNDEQPEPDSKNS